MSLTLLAEISNAADMFLALLPVSKYNVEDILVSQGDARTHDYMYHRLMSTWHDL